MTRLLLLLLICCLSNSATAVVFYIEGLPDVPIYRWVSGTDGPVEAEGKSANNYDRILVDVPDEYIISTDKDHIDLPATLENWRRNTPVGPQHPKTVDGVARYPFREEKRTPNDPYAIPEKRAVRSLDLAYILTRVREIESLKISSGDGRMVEMAPEKPQLIQELKKIKKSEGPVSCRKPKSIDSRAEWTAAECMLCNCANESLATAPPLDRLAIHKVVLRRMINSNEEINKKVFYHHPAYGRSICGMVLGKKRYSGKIGLQFSWTSGAPRQTIFELPARHGSTQEFQGPTVAGGAREVLKDCVDTAIQALNDTVNGSHATYDHYHNTSVCPDWARKKNGCSGRLIHLHKYYTLYPFSDGNMPLLKKELGASQKAVIRPLLEDFWPEGGNPNDSTL